MTEAKRRKILLLVHRYPQVTQTYIETERRELSKRYDVRVVAFNEANTPFADHGDFALIPRHDSRRLRAAVSEFQPDMIHAHWLFLTDKAFEASQMAGVPFTVRAHSFDVLAKDQTLRKSSVLVNADNCAGILSFPFTLPILEREGFNVAKVHECHPVLDFERFYDVSPNRNDVMNVGAWKPKKNMEWFFELAKCSRGRGLTFDLYAPGIDAQAVISQHGLHDAPVVMRDPVEPAEMPAEYKKHEWLVYTASPSYNTVGWPVVIGEAQASGVGVCMQNIRPDLAEYVGEGGYLFDSLAEVKEIISRPFPERQRQLGFEQAKRSDVRTHISKLERLWNWRLDTVDMASIDTGRQLERNRAMRNGPPGC